MKKSFAMVIRRRMHFVFFFFLLAYGALLGRLFLLQIVHHQDYLRLAAKQHELVKEIYPERGVIFAQDKNHTLIPLALNRTYTTVAVSPRAIKDREAVARALQESLALKHEEIMEKLSLEDDPYEIIAKKVEAEIVEKLKVQKWEGVFFEEEKHRAYPHGSLAANLLGFVRREGDKEDGQYGIERRYQEDLLGEKGFFEGAKDAAGFWIALGKRIIHPPKNGSSIVLTLDYNIQVKAEEVLAKLQERWGAEGGIIVVMEPQSGRILAEASSPRFDPNAFGREKDFSVFLNPLAESMYELGSVMKPFVMAAGIGEKRITKDSVYHDPGEFRIGGYTIKNFDGKSYGTQTMTQVLEKSLNTGAVHVARLLGKETQRRFLEQFGFGEKTGIDLPGEVSGDLSNLKNGRDIDFATASFGQGIAVTPIQLAAAVGVFANHGKLMKPYVAEKIMEDSGNEITRAPEVRREVVSPQTAEEVTKMLVSAVRNGFENRAGVKGYFVAGKTGTAQVPRKDGRGYSDKVIHTFAGYAPAFDPRFLIVLQLNQPKGNRFAANTLTPAFHDLAEFILNYYEIPPDEK